MRKSFAIGAVLAAACAAPGSAATYIAYTSFNVVGNTVVGSGPFAFGYSTPAGFTGTLLDFPQIEAACGGDTNIQCAKNSVVGVYKAPAGDYDQPGTAFYTDGFLNLHPGPAGDTAGIAFTAPVAGNYVISGKLAAHDVVANQKGYSVYQGTTLLGSGTFNLATTFSNPATLAAGAKLTFLLDYGNDGFQNDSTGLALSVMGPSVLSGVPEPSTWALMIVGLGAVGGMMRRRAHRPARQARPA